METTDYTDERKGLKKGGEGRSSLIRAIREIRGGVLSCLGNGNYGSNGKREKDWQ